MVLRAVPAGAPALSGGGPATSAAPDPFRRRLPVAMGHTRGALRLPVAAVARAAPAEAAPALIAAPVHAGAAGPQPGIQGARGLGGGDHAEALFCHAVCAARGSPRVGRGRDFAIARPAEPILRQAVVAPPGEDKLISRSFLFSVPALAISRLQLADATRLVRMAAAAGEAMQSAWGDIRHGGCPSRDVAIGNPDAGLPAGTILQHPAVCARARIGTEHGTCPAPALPSDGSSRCARSVLRVRRLRQRPSRMPP